MISDPCYCAHMMIRRLRNGEVYKVDNCIAWKERDDVYVVCRVGDRDIRCVLST